MRILLEPRDTPGTRRSDILPVTSADWTRLENRCLRLLIYRTHVLSGSLDKLTRTSSVDLMPGTLSEKARAAVGDGGVSEFYTHREALYLQTVGLLLNQEPLSPHQSSTGARQSACVCFIRRQTASRGMHPLRCRGLSFYPQAKHPLGVGHCSCGLTAQFGIGRSLRANVDGVMCRFIRRT